MLEYVNACSVPRGGPAANLSSESLDPESTKEPVGFVP